MYSAGCMKKLVMVEEWVSEEPHMVCHHVEEQNCYAVMKTKYVPRKVSTVRVWRLKLIQDISVSMILVAATHLAAYCLL